MTAKRTPDRIARRLIVLLAGFTCGMATAAHVVTPANAVARGPAAPR